MTRRSPPACSRSAAWVKAPTSPKPSAPSPMASWITPPARSSTLTAASACAVCDAVRFVTEPRPSGSVPAEPCLRRLSLPDRPHVQILLLVAPFLHLEDLRTHRVDISRQRRLVFERAHQAVGARREAHEVVLS